jgi:alpha-glucoside transport system substrate-binding protein
MSSVRRIVRPAFIMVVLLAACGQSGCTGSASSATTVTVLGTWTDTEEAGFMAMVHGFEVKYHNQIHVIYTGLPDASAVLKNEVNNGHPPDLAVLANPGTMEQYAKEGKLYPIDRALDLSTINRKYSSGWLQNIQATGPTGSKNDYAIIVKAALKSVIWYDPAQFPPGYLGLLRSPNLTWNQLMSMTERLAAPGSSPWCVGMADGSNSGWPGTDWIEDIVLHQSGLQVYDQWVRGTLPWTSAPITQAWQAFRQIAATPRLVHGGTPSELATNPRSVGQGLFTTPPGCYLDHEGSFITDFYETHDTVGGVGSTSHPGPGTGFNFIPFPALTSVDRNNIEVSGDLIGMFTDSLAARKFLAYLTTPQAQEAWISRAGSGAFSVNKDVPTSFYPDQVSSEIGKILTQAVDVRFDASDSMPPIMETAFNDAVLDYIDNPGQLHTILQGLDQVQKAEYAGG